MRTISTPRDAHVSPNLVRWGAVFAGTLISLGFFALVSTLWLALSYNDTSDWVSGNLPWFLGATAVSALFLAGLLSGFLSGVRGAGAGLLNGLTAWGLLFITSVLTVVPGLTAITMNLGAGLGSGSNAVGTVGGGLTAESAVWTTFWSLLAGAVVAALGGIVGGAAKRQPKITDAEVRGQHESKRDADDRVYPVEPVTSVTVQRPAEDRVSTGIGTEETRRH